MSLKILFLGDIMGRPGRTAIKEHLPKLIEKLELDFVVANGENASGGRGLTIKDADELYNVGINCFTTGDHIWDQKDMEYMLENDRKLVRPANMPKGNFGKGFRIFTLDNAKNKGKRVAVTSLMGNVFMRYIIDSPAQVTKELQQEYRIMEDYDALIVDIHAEANGEKAVLAHMWDGKASLVTGSHTHLPTADTRIMPKGTGFQADAGMCGFYESSLGMSYETVMPRMIMKNRPPMMQIASGEGTVCGVYAEVDDNGKCINVRPVRIGGVLSQTENF